MGPPAHPKAELVVAVRRAVQDFVAASPRELESRRRTLVELDGLADPFSREAGPVHVTGSGFVVGRRGTVLLVHRKLGIWVQPGGHVDAGEAPWEAALREGNEETGLALQHPPGGPCLVHVDVHPAAAGHVHLDLRYLLECPDDADPAPQEGESANVRWFGLDAALEVADEGLVEGLRRVADMCPELRR
ncbi:MAG TPA: NUDIX domain-containing protein [Acidimicrobiales bacterium]|nr:NUDIX domain-containing protein [Acidimicrobiales bacterium]